MKRVIIVLTVLFFISCNNHQAAKNIANEKAIINQTLENWHQNAAKSKYKEYFEAMDNRFVFMGTDASEHWNKKAFEKFSKPFFDRGKAWNFKPLKRNIYIDDDLKTAWFDEILDTWMGVCRGSGVLVKKENTWKITQYVLSLTVPNNNIDEVIKINKQKDSLLIKKLTR